MATEVVGSVGMLLLVQFRTTRGYYCRDCVPIIFGKATAQNLTVGLLWAFGFLAGPLLTLTNLFSLIASRRLPLADGNATVPEIDDLALSRVHEIVPRITSDIETQTGDLHESAARFATDADVRPAQIIHALRLMAEAALPAPGGPGFEVIVRHQPQLPEHQQLPGRTSS